ncbi:PREDICTED: uncharacterized protein LOC104597595 [Nelumbo nucifera]|uniref:Uncharacterized protein LOC104597595 n=1 Tax=Nelumbo nucifera TaxID=4432 RepID=A0A1U7ZYW7_NELNU|nr:PREDICTED: uncharacterized protein LOC104597595 [Nelumbo nucifera]
MAAGTKVNTSSYGVSEQRLVVTAMVVLLCGLLWYVVYDAIMVPAAEQFKRFLVISPLLLVVVVHWLSAVPPSSRFSFPVPGSEPGAIHRAGGSPWGVAFVLLLLFFLISYQPSFYRLV